MVNENGVSLDKHCKSVYQRIKGNCCDEWKSNRLTFYGWYKDRLAKQEGLCEYCHLRGDTMLHYKRRFRPNRKGGFNRGLHLEVDRRISKDKDGPTKYEPTNCVLACYPCNNAKSDVFTYDEFRQIGEMICKVKKGC